MLSVAGVRALEVENRFIDYFKEHTEIYQGMELLDARLGGTIPLDVILEAPAEEPEVAEAASSSDDEGWEDDDDGFFDDVFDIDFGFGADETQSAGYWFSYRGANWSIRYTPLSRVGPSREKYCRYPPHSK